MYSVLYYFLTNPTTATTINNVVISLVVLQYALYISLWFDRQLTNGEL